MKRVRKTVSIITIAVLTLTAMSCKDEKNEEPTEPISNEMHQEDSNNGSKQMTDAGSNASDAIIDNYLKIKNALVEENQKEAAKAGGDLIGDFEDFDKSSYSSEEKKELTDIIEDAKEHAEHISESPIEHQREHFDILSKDVIDLIAITGTDKKLYQDFCPMYNDNKGAQWLSETKEIKNPYFGSKMMKCGTVQKEIN